MKNLVAVLLFMGPWCVGIPLAVGQTSNPVRIGIVVDGPWERNDALRDLLQNEIREVLGTEKPVIFPGGSFLVGDWTLTRVRALNSQLLADPGIDMVLGMGLITSQDLATRGPLPKPVIAPIIIDVERQHIPFTGGTSGVKNLSYLVYPMTFVRDLQLFREIIPIRKLVNISSKPYDDALPPRRCRSRNSDAGSDSKSMRCISAFPPTMFSKRCRRTRMPFSWSQPSISPRANSRNWRKASSRAGSRVFRFLVKVKCVRGSWRQRIRISSLVWRVGSP